MPASPPPPPQAANTAHAATISSKTNLCLVLVTSIPFVLGLVDVASLVERRSATAD
jgi:hypothetical protein